MVDPLYADSAFGVWPDTIEDFASGNLNVFFSDTLQFKIPTSTLDIDPNLPAFTIDSVVLNGIDGLPNGLGIVCNSHTSSQCTFLANIGGCGLVEGVPTESGVFELTIQVTAYVFLGAVIPIDYPFDGYEIEIMENGVGIDENTTNHLSAEQNVPNPFTGETQINVSLRDGSDIEFRVRDMVGKTLFESVQRGVPGANSIKYDAQGLNSGIYLYTVESNGQSVTKRMIVK